MSCAFVWALRLMIATARCSSVSFVRVAHNRSPTPPRVRILLPVAPLLSNASPPGDFDAAMVWKGLVNPALVATASAAAAAAVAAAAALAAGDRKVTAAGRGTEAELADVVAVAGALGGRRVTTPGRAAVSAVAPLDPGALGHERFASAAFCCLPIPAKAARISSSILRFCRGRGGAEAAPPCFDIGATAVVASGLALWLDAPKAAAFAAAAEAAP
mmetsp:Transcript_70146/g.195149  ORF Transcript_70146/g.195149 Transcript_70146/m.195149 type:complete len:216 (-) Transcript_70146:399-1046(-)